MKFKVVTVALVGMASAGMLCAVAAQEHSQWDGVYSVEQAKRGEALYAETCANCHGSDLAGIDAPGLTGSGFDANWVDLTLDRLFEKIRTSMPENNPGTLSRQQTADVVAFVLQKSGAPTGSKELSAEIEMLKAIKFVPAKK